MICDGRDIAHISLLPKLLRQPFADSFIDDSDMNLEVKKLSPRFYIAVLVALESHYIKE
jgi:hypothetical protein